MTALLVSRLSSSARFRCRGALSLALGMSALALPTVARGQEEAAAVSPARQLFLDGRKLAQEGKYAAACPKFEESLRLEVGVGTQFNLADCWEHIGRTASARAVFLGAAASAKAVGQLEREQVLRERVAALEPRLTRVVIEVLAKDPKIVVKRNDLPLESEDWGKAIPMDPGKYTVSARAPGKKSWEKSVEVTAGTPVVTVRVPELEAEEPAPKASPSKPAAALKKATPVAPPPAPAVSDRESTINYRAATVAGVGVAALAVGVVTGLQYKSANDDAKSICPANKNCSVKQIQDHDKLVDDAKTARAWSYAGFTVGALGLAGGAALWLFSPSKPSATALRAAPIVAADGCVGALVQGSF